MSEIREFKIATLELGKREIVFVPMSQNGVENTIGFFKRIDGNTKPVYFDNLTEAVDNSIPLLAINFKSKKSINELIKFLRFYRDNIYKQGEKQ